MTHLRTLSLSIALLIAPVGCTMGADVSDEEGSIDEAAMAIISDNALIPNALIPNALIPNALIPNALIPNALIPNALAPSALAAITDPGTAGELSRMFVKYAVGCALTPLQSFSFSWTDTDNVVHNESYPGRLSIAPSWAIGPLNIPSQEMVSACIAARTNYYGTEVIISLRSHQVPLKTFANSPEVTTYPYIEGAFWGNLFEKSPHLNACYTTASVAHSRAALRECAAGHLDAGGLISQCGIIDIVGSCESRCKGLDIAGKYYPECSTPGSSSAKNVGTTALP